MTQLDVHAVRTAYRRQAAFYDRLFGKVSHGARLRAVAAVNVLAGERVLEVGVGTGLALPHYAPGKRITGIDLSADMLERARARVAAKGLGDQVEALLERDAESTGLPSAAFDIAAVMFVASVVPNPRALLAELRRVVRPGGTILFVNHFSASGGVQLAAERALSRLSHTLGWHPDFAKSDLFDEDDLALASFEPMPPLGVFTLVHLPR